MGQDTETASFHLSSRLVSANFPPGFFSHVFIDECGRAVEPESVVAIAGEWCSAPVSRTFFHGLGSLPFPTELSLFPGLLAPMDQETNPNGGQLVLAGDPKQLGPVLTSPLAIQHGLGEYGEGWECCRHPTGAEWPCGEPQAVTGHRHLAAGEADAAQPPVQEVEWRIQPTVHHQAALELQVGTGVVQEGIEPGWDW